MDVDAETEIIFRRLDRQIINRNMARAAIKYLARDCAAGDAGDILAGQVDTIFDEHETTRKHPLFLAFRIKRLLDEHADNSELTEIERRVRAG